VDIVPRYLPGGPCISCFNAIDVVSRYLTGRQYIRKRSEDTVQFLLQAWCDLGVPLDIQQVGELDFSPDIFGVILVKALNRAIALRVANGRENQLSSCQQLQAKHSAEASRVSKTTTETAFIIHLGIVRDPQFSPDLGPKFCTNKATSDRKETVAA
jgi:hypothetical protein